MCVKKLEFVDFIQKNRWKQLTKLIFDPLWIFLEFYFTEKKIIHKSTYQCLCLQAKLRNYKIIRHL